MKAVLLALALVIVAAPAASAADPGILYSADARNAKVVKSGKTLRVSLPAGTRTTWFADRPGRHAGTTTLSRLVRIWDASGFRKDPPNAALLLAHKGKVRSHVVTLSDPRRTRGRVSFRVRVVRGGAEAGHRHIDRVATGRYGRAQLFIDDTAYPPCPAFAETLTTCILAPRSVFEISSAEEAIYWQIPVSVCSLGSTEISLVAQLVGTGQVIPSSVPGNPPLVGTVLPSGPGPVFVDTCPDSKVVASLYLDPLGNPGAAAGVLVVSGSSSPLLVRYGP